MHKDKHLDDDAIARAAVDKAMIGKAGQVHLEVCPECSLRLKKLTEVLELTGEVAKRAVPAMESSVNLDAIPAHRGIRWAWGTVIGLAFSVAVILLVLNLTAVKTDVQQPDGRVAVYSELDDDMLISEVNMLVDNALPEGWSVMYSSDELQTDEDSIELLAPIDEGTYLEIM